MRTLRCDRCQATLFSAAPPPHRDGCPHCGHRVLEPGGPAEPQRRELLAAGAPPPRA